MRADQDAAYQQDDNLRDPRAGQDGDDERRERGHQRYGNQVHQPLVEIHDGRLTGRMFGGRRRDTGSWCGFGGREQDGCGQADQADDRQHEHGDAVGPAGVGQARDFISLNSMVVRM